MGQTRRSAVPPHQVVELGARSLRGVAAVFVARVHSERASFAALFKDFTDFGASRATDATTVYALVESLIPFASL